MAKLDVSPLEEISAAMDAVQAAAIVHDYRLAIELLCRYALTHRCLVCVGEVDAHGYRWRLGWAQSRLRTFYTCRSCSRKFAETYTSKSREWRIYDGSPGGPG